MIFFKKNFFKVSIAFFSFFILLGCQKNSQPELVHTYTSQDAEINQLKIKISELEHLIKGPAKNNSKPKLKGKRSKIKTITFRIGSNEDRIRIYWEDGSKTDLECTKEHFTWACG